jgi:hypothetical protein
MDGILLEVRNQKEPCYAWILYAATSHIRTWSRCYSQGTTDAIITLSVQCSDTSWLLALILMRPFVVLLAIWVHDIADHALKLISAPNLPPSEGNSLSTL